VKIEIKAYGKKIKIRKNKLKIKINHKAYSTKHSTYAVIRREGKTPLIQQPLALLNTNL